MKNLRQRIVAFVAGAVLTFSAGVWAGLESGTYISDLVATNPLGSDLASTLDDHLRLLKSTIKTTFPNINNAVTSSDEELNLVDGIGTVWGSGNDGTGSGLDADFVDGTSIESIALYANTTSNFTGTNLQHNGSPVRTTANNGQSAYASITNGSTGAVASGLRVTLSSKPDVGDYIYTLSGFSASPICVCSPANNVGASTCTLTVSSSTSVEVVTYNSSNAAANTAFSMMCIGT